MCMCKQVLGHKELYEDQGIAHGICLQCQKKHFPELKTKHKNILGEYNGNCKTRNSKTI